MKGLKRNSKRAFLTRITIHTIGFCYIIKTVSECRQLANKMFITKIIVSHGKVNVLDMNDYS